MDGQGSDNLREPAPTVDWLEVDQQLVRQAVIIRVPSMAPPVDCDLSNIGRVGLNLLLVGGLGALEPRSQRCTLPSLVSELVFQFQDPFPQSIVFLFKFLLSDTASQEAGHQKYRYRLMRGSLERHV